MPARVRPPGIIIYRCYYLMEQAAVTEVTIPTMSETKPLTDEELMARIKRGDRNSFSELVTRHTNRYYRLAYRMLANREEAEDTVQESFLMLWTSPGKWDGGKNARFTTWFYRVVANACLDRRKKARTLPLDEG